MRARTGGNRISLIQNTDSTKPDSETEALLVRWLFKSCEAGSALGQQTRRGTLIVRKYLLATSVI